MLDFTSSLYLGFWHGSDSLRPWARLTTGVPAALARPPAVGAVEQRLARLHGCERSLLGPSTLHLFWDLFGLLGDDGVAIYVDSAAYPIARWATARAVARGASVRVFPHRDARALRTLVEQARDRRPVVVADGMCDRCGAVVPLADYLDCIRPHGGVLVLDDTQSLGIAGVAPSPAIPYGSGGGGSLRQSGVGGSDVVLVESLAKAFGVPVAALSGSQELVARFEAASQTRVHCSPPSAAEIHAAENALALNEQVGDALRERLARRVQLFRDRLGASGLASEGGLFPVQRLPELPVDAARALYARLRGFGVRPLLLAGRSAGTGQVAFAITARHRIEAIERGTAALAGAGRETPWPRLAPG